MEPASLIEMAQAAAGAGDFPTAERLLRDAAAMQEATLGSDHPDLAKTLNNLAFVCERTNKLADAERGYRRAHAIAVASLGPRHPFVATSVKNLVDFCAAHDIPIWTPPTASSDEPYDDADADTASVLEEPPPRVTDWLANRTTALVALGLVVIVALVFIIPSRKTVEPGTASSPAPIPTVVTPTAQPTVALEAPPPDTTPQRVERPAPRENREDNATAPTVTVLTAQLCAKLERRGTPDWQCSPASGDLRPGTYTFYTRVLTTTSTTIEHRWYHTDRVHQVMRLRVSANPNGGYRTFSSNTISAERAGEWRVELRAADGTLLQTEAFTVR